MYYVNICDMEVTIIKEIVHIPLMRIVEGNIFNANFFASRTNSQRKKKLSVFKFFLKTLPLISIKR